MIDVLARALYDAWYLTPTQNPIPDATLQLSASRLGCFIYYWRGSDAWWLAVDDTYDEPF